MDINDFINIEFIRTFTGCITATILIVQFLKDLPFIKEMPTRYFTFIIATLNIVIATIFPNTIVEMIYLTLLNGIVTGKQIISTIVLGNIVAITILKEAIKKVKYQVEIGRAHV